MYFRFTDYSCRCLRSFLPLCIVARVSRANSPKGGDAKPPVYGQSAYDSGVAGVNVRRFPRNDRYFTDVARTQIVFLRLLSSGTRLPIPDGLHVPLFPI